MKTLVVFNLLVIMLCGAANATPPQGDKPHITCPARYQPVYGTMPDGTVRLFSNECFATTAGAKVMSDGPGSFPEMRVDEGLPWPFPWAYNPRRS